MTEPVPISETALLLCDLQNDFVHPKGAYGRAGQASAEIAALPSRLRLLAQAMRTAGGWVVATQFTLVPGRGGETMIAPHLKGLRPFLTKGDFMPGAWGHAMVDELQPIDLSVEKIAYSAFFNTRLEWVLRKSGIRRLLVAGIVTNGGVASTLRDAHVREFDVTLLEDGCAAFSPAVHDATVASLRALCPVTTIDAALRGLQA
jgi:ureidoacrylate peracid hydrolase